MPVERHTQHTGPCSVRFYSILILFRLEKLVGETGGKKMKKKNTFLHSLHLRKYEVILLLQRPKMTYKQHKHVKLNTADTKKKKKKGYKKKQNGYSRLMQYRNVLLTTETQPFHTIKAYDSFGRAWVVAARFQKATDTHIFPYFNFIGICRVMCCFSWACETVNKLWLHLWWFSSYVGWRGGVSCVCVYMCVFKCVWVRICLPVFVVIVCITQAKSVWLFLKLYVMVCLSHFLLKAKPS